jgi:GTP-binding protein HflX
MGIVTGEIKSLAASEKSALEKLSHHRGNAKEFLSPELAKRTALVCAKLGVYLGLVLGRDGKIRHVVVGSRDRLYLPDLGRFRLDSARLRRLRFIVFSPDGRHRLEKQESTSMFAPTGRGSKAIASPVVADDFLTDLEKLRFDALMVVAVLPDGSPGPITLAHLQPSAEQGRNIAMLHLRDLYALQLDHEDFIRELEAGFGASRSQGFDTSKDHAVLIGAYTCSAAIAEASMNELLELTRTADVQVLDTIIQRRRSLDPRTLVGKGKLEEIVLHCLDLGADLLIVDRELSPGQLRWITTLTELRVIDRSMLILDIFSQRAKSSEGRLQVELAQLKYTLPRLTDRDTGLSRLTGGIGGRGPGETKLEVSRRRTRDRIVELERRIERLAQQRGLRRERRQLRGVPVIAIVGYTNAGKSTLLNALTKGTVFAEDKLFATLDPSSRRMRFPNEKEVIFVDTVGFIRELPAELVTAFRATLEEVGEADLLLHVVDASNVDMAEQIKVVNKTLEDLGFGDKPQILVLNKTDLLSPIEVRTLERSTNGLSISAATREGLEKLVEMSQEFLLETFTGQDPGRFTELPPGGEGVS